MVRSVSAETFQPNIGFKTRYGIVANPFAEGGIGGPNRGNQGLGDDLLTTPTVTTDSTQC